MVKAFELIYRQRISRAGGHIEINNIHAGYTASPADAEAWRNDRAGNMALEVTLDDATADAEGL